MTELEKNHIDQHKTLIAKLKSVDVSMYQDGYELGYTGGVATAEARIAELEAKLCTMSELEEQHLLCIDEQSARIAGLEQTVGYSREDYVRAAIAYEAKIAELESQVATLTIDVADWKAIAGASENIANIAVQRYKDASGTVQS